MRLSSKPQFRSSALLKRKRRRLVISSVLVSLAAAVFLGGGTYLSHLPKISIERAYVEGNAAVSSEEILTSLREEIQGRYLGLFSKKNIFLYPKKEISLRLLRDFPRLSAASVGFRDFESVTVEIEERGASGIWCGESLDKNGDCYFLDGDGFLFAKAPKFSSQVFVEYYGPISSSTPLRASLLTPEELHRTWYLLHELGRLGLIPQSFYADLTIRREIVFGSGGRLIFESTRDYGGLLRDLEALLQSEPFKGFNRETFDLDYIDMRLGSKVFYKKR